MTTPDAPELVMDEAFADFVKAVEHEVTTIGDDEQAVTAAVAVHLQTWLDRGVVIPEPWRAPNEDHYVMYPLFVADDGSSAFEAVEARAFADLPFEQVDERFGPAGARHQVQRPQR